MRSMLGNDTGAISAVRCLKLYLERLGADFHSAGARSLTAVLPRCIAHSSMSPLAAAGPVRQSTHIAASMLNQVHSLGPWLYVCADALRSVAGASLDLIHAAASDSLLSNACPSLLAAALLAACRRARGVSPGWPQALHRLTGECSHAWNRCVIQSHDVSCTCWVFDCVHLIAVNHSCWHLSSLFGRITS